MKKTIIFLVLFFSSSILAQPAKVLVCAPGDLNAAKSTDTTLQKFYHEKIDISDTLTDAINNYDAVFLLVHWDHNLTQDGGKYLHEYLKSNKKLYIEPAGIIDSNEFWKFIDVSQGPPDLLERHIKSVIGAHGSFAEGLNVTNSNYDRFRADLGGGFHIDAKNLATVLIAECESSLSLAQTYETDSFKVVIHVPVIPDYYQAFLGRVICNYFGLCEPLDVEASDQTAQPSFSIYPNPAHDKFSVIYDTPYSSQNTLELFSSSGSLVSKYSLESNQVDIDLGAKNLSSGTYFLRMLTEKGSLTRPIYLQSK